MQVLVTGGTGLVGKALVPRLLAEGFRVRVLVRPKSTAPFPAHPELEIIRGDMLDAPALKAGCMGTDAVIHLAAQKNDERDSEQVNVVGAELLGKAAADTHVKHIVHLSTQSVLLPRKGMYATTKLAAEKALDASGVPVTHLRCSVVYGNEPEGIVGSIANFAKLPRIPVIGTGGGHFAPIHRDDLAEAMVQVLRRPELEGKTFDVGGPDVLSFLDMAQKILAVRGTPRKFLYIPESIAMLMARMFSVLPRSPLTVSNVLGAVQDVPLDTKPFLDAVHVNPRHFAEGLEDCLFLKPPSEAEVILRYVLSGWRHAPAVVPEVHARFLEALRVHGLEDATELSPEILHSQGLLTAVDWLTKMRAPQCALQRKLLIAVAIRETTPESAVFLLPPSGGAVSVWAKLIGLGFAQCVVVLRALLLFLRPAIWRPYVS